MPGPQCGGPATSARLLVELALVSVRPVQLGTQRACFGPIEIEGIGELALVAGLCFDVVQRGHAVTFAVE